MRRKNNQNKNTIFILIFLVLVGIGVAYAVLTEQLTINNTVSYDAMKWDVGFSKTEDNGGTITSTSSITNEGKSITVNCDFGKSTTQQSCIVKATITNNGTFDIGLSSDPLITYDDTYIHTMTFKWEDHPTYLNTTVLERGFVEKGTSQNVILTVKTKNLTKDMLPADGVTIPITITLDFEEWQEESLPTTEDLAILRPTECTSSGSGSALNDPPTFSISCEENSLGEMMRNMSSYLKTLTFENKIEIPEDAIEVADISFFENSSIIASYVINEEYSTDTDTYFDAYIQSDNQIYAHPDMSWWFIMAGVEQINGLELLDTSLTTNMEGMFACLGVLNQNLAPLDLSNFDTSNVTKMNRMFSITGLMTQDFSVDVSRFDTSNVTDMSYMFESIGAFNPNFSIDVSNFDTSKVINMSYMFYEVGFYASNLALDLSNFNTSNVTDMSSMFEETGYASETLTIDVSNFDTSNVTNMSDMFERAGYESESIYLDVSNFDTSNVTNMGRMFSCTGYRSPTFDLDTSHFDTSNVENTEYMFHQTGYKSTKFVTTITIRSSNITSYSSMFYNVALQPGSQITVNYTSETSDLVDQILATKSSNSNVVKGVQID